MVKLVMVTYFFPSLVWLLIANRGQLQTDFLSAVLSLSGKDWDLIKL